MEVMGNRLWTAAFQKQQGDSDATSRARRRLETALVRFRERAGQLVEEIKRDLPEFTEHGLTHLDALWEMAELLIAPDASLNPAEAFVLGGAFLLHDAGLGVAAYPEGPSAFEQDPGYIDIVRTQLKRLLGRAPSAAERENPPADVVLSARADFLRLRHAERAEKLASISWTDRSGEKYYLLEDTELRRGFAETIGTIAHSHWWSVEELGQKFNRAAALSPPATCGLPNDWTVDRLKMACLLRAADAIHLDARRAPGYLRALRRPSDYSDLHWIFQGRIHKPNIDGDRLVFTSGSAFPLEEADAWWLGFDLLRQADRELRQIDALLQDLKYSERLAVRSVSAIDSPVRLTENFIPTVGWLPVDAQLRVSDVASLVTNLGGEQLYGKDPLVPLRELIQNATDAVRARRLLQKKGDTWGDVRVRLGSDQDGEWFEVEDSGIGMSTAVLSGPFLDFGRSYWGTAQMRADWPGLEGKGFDSTGRYGIGFFSVFMLAKRVNVTTRRFRDAERDTWVLAFSRGLESRPVLRRAQESEVLQDGGTRVRVWLKDDQRYRGGIHSLEWLLSQGEDLWRKLSFRELLAWLCPTLDANLWYGDERVVEASDWQSMDGQALCRRIWLEYGDKLETWWSESWREQLACAERYRPLRDEDGRTIGRAAIPLTVMGTRETAGLITVGGFRTSDTSYVAGVLEGMPTRASRDEGRPIVSGDELSRWALEQATLISSDRYQVQDLVKLAERIRQFGGKTGSLPIAACESGWVNANEIAGLVNDAPWRQRVLLADANQLLYFLPYANFQLNAGVLAVSRRIVAGAYYDRWKPTSTRTPPGVRLDMEANQFGTLRFAVIECLAEAWGAPLVEVLRSSILHAEREGEPLTEIGTLDSRFEGGKKSKWAEAVDVIVRPSST